MRSAAGQVERLLQWAASFTERTWAIEGAGGLGYLLAQQLVGAGGRVVDVQPKLAARVQLLATGSSNKNDPNDARSVAVGAQRARVPEVWAEDHVNVMKVWTKRPVICEVDACNLGAMAMAACARGDGVDVGVYMARFGSRPQPGEVVKAAVDVVTSPEYEPGAHLLTLAG